jgi:hypothetical protein
MTLRVDLADRSRDLYAEPKRRVHWDRNADKPGSPGHLCVETFNRHIHRLSSEAGALEECERHRQAGGLMPELVARNNKNRL